MTRSGSLLPTSGEVVAVAPVVGFLPRMRETWIEFLTLCSSLLFAAVPAFCAFGE